MKNLFFLFKRFLFRLVETYQSVPVYKDISLWKRKKNQPSFTISWRKRLQLIEYNDIYNRFNIHYFRNDLFCYAVPIRNTLFNLNYHLNRIINENHDDSAIQDIIGQLRIGRFIRNGSFIGHNISVENENSRSASRHNMGQLVEATENTQSNTGYNVRNIEGANEGPRANTSDTLRQQSESPLESSSDSYSSEWMRLASFANFDSQSIQAIPLARNGWYSIGTRDQTVCFSCHRMHENWRRDENPDDLHDTNCRFINGLSTNVPIPRPHPMNRGNPQTNIVNERNIRNLQEGVVAFAIPYMCPAWPFMDHSTPTNTNNGPKYPEYCNQSVRIASFDNWLQATSQTADDLATAGFFFDRNSDHVRCFFCGGGLRNWSDGDQPWVEHARWFSTCGYLRRMKGSQFIDEVIQVTRTVNNEKSMTFPKKIYLYSEVNDILLTPGQQNTSMFDSSHGSYSNELIRLASFANFESEAVYAIRLATNGWYCTGNRDQTMCCSCLRVHENWTRDDNPRDFHDINCRFFYQ